MAGAWWRREGAGLRPAVGVLRGDRSRDERPVVDGVQQPPAALAETAGQAGRSRRAMPRAALTGFMALLLIAGCGANDAPISAARPFADPGMVAAGDQQMHYALTMSRDLAPAIAGSYGIVPRRNLAVLTVALRSQSAAGDAGLAAAELSATAIELSGARRPLRFARHDGAGGPTYLADAEVRHRVPLTFEIRARATPEGPEMTVRVTREFYLE